MKGQKIVSQGQPEDPYARHARRGEPPRMPMHVQPHAPRQYPQRVPQDFPQQLQPLQPRTIEARGTVKTAAWDGNAMVIRTRLSGSVVTIPAGQVASVRVQPLGPKLTVTTTDGRAHQIPYWPWRGRDFRALRDAVTAAAAVRR